MVRVRKSAQGPTTVRYLADTTHINEHGGFQGTDDTVRRAQRQQYDYARDCIGRIMS